jgi:hypothetical protein
MARRRWIVWLGLALVLALSVTPSANAVTLGAPGGFRLQGSNGYSIRALAADGDPQGRPDALILFVSRKDGDVTYFFQHGVEVTEDTVSADLGDFGAVELHFVPTGSLRSEKVSCFNEPIKFDSGFYEGRIEFEGEEGFTAVHRDRARGEASFRLGLICGSSLDESTGGHSPGARLSVGRRWSTGSLKLEATKNSSTRPSHFEATIEERNGRSSIVRVVRSKASSDAFRFDVPRQRARLNPPTPFSGSAGFHSEGSQRGRLQGALTVDFPGHADVSLDRASGSLGR